jgi:hypothetical protein
MAGETTDSGFFIWERNRSAQGPVELPALIRMRAGGRLRGARGAVGRTAAPAAAVAG